MTSVWQQYDGVNCPNCNMPTKIIKTNGTGLNAWRRRRCTSCGSTIITIESVIPPDQYELIKRNNNRKRYND